MGVASTHSRGCGSVLNSDPVMAGLTGVELLTLFMSMAEMGITLSSSKLVGWMTVPNFLLGLALAGVPVIWLLTILLVTFSTLVNTGLFSPSANV